MCGVFQRTGNKISYRSGDQHWADTGDVYNTLSEYEFQGSFIEVGVPVELLAVKRNDFK
jgi:hypothetical protein